MKKVILIIYATIVLIYCIGNVSNAETVKYNDWKTGESNDYEVNSYDELYSVYEDLNYDYEKCQEDLNSEIQSLKDEITELKEESDTLEQTSTYTEESSNNIISLLLMISILINLTTVPYMIYSLKNN